MAKLLREGAALPRAQRQQKPLPGQPPRVETFSFKRRALAQLYREAERHRAPEAEEPRGA